MTTPKVPNESLVVTIRQGIVAAEERYILEQGIDRCSALCDEYMKDPDRFGDASPSSDESRLCRSDISSFREQIGKMRREAAKMQSRGGLAETVAMVMGFEMVEHQEKAIRASAGEGIDIEQQPSEVFITNTRRRLRRMESAGSTAMDQLYEQNKAMIFKVARSVSKGVPELNDELVSVANHQFVECARRTWDPNRGIKFSTYAWGTMRGKCAQAMTEMRMVRLPSFQTELVNRMRRGEVDIDASEIADPKKRKRASEVRRDVMNSVRGPRSIESMADAGDFVSGISNPEDVIDEVAVKSLIEEIMGGLPDVKRDLLRIRVGDVVRGDDPAVMKEIAERLHEAGHTEVVVTRQRVQQIMADLKRDVLRHLRLRDRDMLEELGLVEESEKAKVSAGGR